MWQLGHIKPFGVIVGAAILLGGDGPQELGLRLGFITEALFDNFLSPIQSCLDFAFIAFERDGVVRLRPLVVERLVELLPVGDDDFSFWFCVDFH